MHMKTTPTGSDDNGSAQDSSPASGEHSYAAIATILNSLDALVYVADMNTHEVLFFNDYGHSIWGDPTGLKCFQVLQKGQRGPCEFCSNHKLLDEQGQPTGVYVWEFQNTQNGRWYQCRDQAIRWIDGRLVRMEIATDITERKQLEQSLEEARQRAEHLAHTDELTGLYNRRAFFNSARHTLHQVLRSQQPMCLIMFDVDNFKRINADFGHSGGDEVLRQLAKVATETIRAADLLARIGGEEFVVLMPNTEQQEAMVLAERLRQAVAGLALEFNGQPLKISASFGVALAHLDAVTEGMIEQDASEVSLTTKCIYDLLRHADKAMFEAKRAGRNRVALFAE